MSNWDILKDIRKLLLVTRTRSHDAPDDPILGSLAQIRQNIVELHNSEDLFRTDRRLPKESVWVINTRHTTAESSVSWLHVSVIYDGQIILG
ncbi:uncharacterized protein Nmag_3663 (plasmid) [Natrialba magadii ATCC 43099]|uniref:Uncharacterized protein n=1 Tax=Natrialba magadii (strain ATCC 43099 / DSM 3394 / CCM 3739 / CIP 104546 / IAM 13178 / JCM 8861 / NBRC 102185 / NCIMB 2190 / MS3) TaxID=547559 RepID=D3T0V2_NATMM|nr:uncharacterized protein Nmag_3663 [Natrialba magadii ATCC 43099]